MSLLCMIGLHRWKQETVLKQTLSSGIVCFLDDDVCQRCEKLRDPMNMASVYGMMQNNDGPIEVHPIANGKQGDSK